MNENKTKTDDKTHSCLPCDETRVTQHTVLPRGRRIPATVAGTLTLLAATAILLFVRESRSACNAPDKKTQYEVKLEPTNDNAPLSPRYRMYSNCRCSGNKHTNTNFRVVVTPPVDSAGTLLTVTATVSGSAGVKATQVGVSEAPWNTKIGLRNGDEIELHAPWDSSGNWTLQIDAEKKIGDDPKCHDKVSDYVIRLDELRIWDEAKPGVRKVDNTLDNATPTDKTLYLCDSNGKATNWVEITWLPAAVAKTEVDQLIRFRIDEDGGGATTAWIPNDANIVSNPQKSIWTKPGADPVPRKFVVHAGLDCTGNNVLDATEFTRELSNVVLKVESVEWETYPGNDALDTCPNNGGKRIYPDKQNPTDSTPAVRKKVQVKAKIMPAITGQTVYFRVFDVDDPSSNTSPVDSNDGSGPTGGDNRGASGALSATSATTDPSGYATVEFTVSMQPGDNFRAFATVCVSALTALSQTQVDSGSIPSGITQSDMLTVWRRLWIERDSMQPIPNNKRYATGWVDKATVGTPNDQTFEAGFVFWADNVHPDVDEYEGGTLRFLLYNGNAGPSLLPGDPVFTVLKNQNNIFSNNRILTKPALSAAQKASIAAATTVKFVMSDDDDYAVFDSPRYPDGGNVLITALKDAYIVPIDATAYNTTPLHPAVVHITAWQANYGMTSTRDLSSAQDCWAAYVLACFELYDGSLAPAIQLFFDSDNDPDSIESVGPTPPSNYTSPVEDPATTLGYAGTSPGWNKALVFMEVIRESPFSTPPAREQHVVTHELGHTAGTPPNGLWHRDPTDPILPLDGKIMRAKPTDFVMHDRFCGEHIDKLRDMLTW